MFINRIAQQVLHTLELSCALKKLKAGDDTTIALAQSARALMLACIFAQNPRPVLFVVSGEEAANRVARSLEGWLGKDCVFRYPERNDLPWSDKAVPSDIVAKRSRALTHLVQGDAGICVASARSLLRKIPPQSSCWFHSYTLSLGQEIAPVDVCTKLISIGYIQTEQPDTPGTFCAHGDHVDIYPANATAPIRLEFFGDEIDRIRRMVASTGQTIGDLEQVCIYPCREMALTPGTIKRAQHVLWDEAQEDTHVAADLELIETGICAPSLEKYLAAFYDKPASPLAYMHADTLVCLAEPRALFDDCSRAYDDISAQAKNAGISLEGLYDRAQDIDFGKQQRLTFASLLRVGTLCDAEMQVRQPNIAGADTRLITRTRRMLEAGISVAFTVPNRQAREHLEMTFTDEAIPFVEAKNTDAQTQALEKNKVTFFDAEIPSGVVLPQAHLAVFSVADLSQNATHKHAQKAVDITNITFPFKPGDYVVHATHGIALFKDIVRQSVAGQERDYFLLEYADQDKLFVPLEQVDRITRYIGADASEPRLTRLNTADWSRAYGKARKHAKKLAFDLVDLYTRRASVHGYSYGADSSEQKDMEADFPYELTPDQHNALCDIKADMESDRPMDRLLCGDVGFGKTEVALRAAFKAVCEHKQVMVLCPTTILAQQHFETFSARFAPYDKRVDVLSRFRTTKQQKESLEAFYAGDCDVLIGTHRLLSADVNPHDLGLVIIDEEQRFGVQHKEQLKNMREQVDVLTLSATPIPRTMQMSLSGVRDMSLILTPPPGRRAVNVSVSEYDQDVVSSAIRAELARDGQVYYVSNRVRTIDDAVSRVHAAAPEARVGVAHGKMTAREVEDVMMRFAEHEIDVLVATTIIESGIDNPHTNTLIIEDSQRMGLAQLYQLKGRVGRGHTQAYAYFMFPAEAPLTPEATQRLMAINEFQDLGSGMRIAMRDLEIRGAGSLMGAEQHGNLTSVGFDLFTQMLGQAVAEAQGQTGEVIENEITINLNADFFFAEEYIPDVDKRVLAYRQVACACTLQQVDEIETRFSQDFGALPQAAKNLLDRARIKIRAKRLGISSISVSAGRITCQGLEISSAQAKYVRDHKGLAYPKTKKLIYPYYKEKEDLLSAVVCLLEEFGGDDEK